MRASATSRRCGYFRRSGCRSCSFRSIPSPIPDCRRKKPPKASALINVARNLGGSIGVSLANTELVQRSQFHQARLVENLIPSSPTFQSAAAQFDAILHAIWIAGERAGPGHRLHRPIGRRPGGAHGLYRHFLQLVDFRRRARADRSLADPARRSGERPGGRRTLTLLRTSRNRPYPGHSAMKKSRRSRTFA